MFLNFLAIGVLNILCAEKITNRGIYFYVKNKNIVTIAVFTVCEKFQFLDFTQVELLDLKSSTGRVDVEVVDKWAQFSSEFGNSIIFSLELEKMGEVELKSLKEVTFFSNSNEFAICFDSSQDLGAKYFEKFIYFQLREAKSISEFKCYQFDLSMHGFSTQVLQITCLTKGIFFSFKHIVHQQETSFNRFYFCVEGKNLKKMQITTVNENPANIKSNDLGRIFRDSESTDSLLEDSSSSKSDEYVLEHQQNDSGLKTAKNQEECQFELMN